MKVEGIERSSSFDDTADGGASVCTRQTKLAVGNCAIKCTTDDDDGDAKVDCVFFFFSGNGYGKLISQLRIVSMDDSTLILFRV